MKWYFARRGDANQRGTADLNQLKQMAAEGTLKRDDLAWNLDNGSIWFPIGNIDGVFPKEEPKPEPPAAPPAPAATQTPQPETGTPPTDQSPTPTPHATAPAPEKTKSKLVPVLITIIVLLIIAGVAAYTFVIAPALTPPTTTTTTTTIAEVLPPPVDYEATAREAEKALLAGDLDAARKAIQILKQNPEYEDKIAALSVQMDTLVVAQEQLKQWEAKLQRGRISKDDSERVVNAFRDNNQMDRLNSILTAISEQQPSDATIAISTARVYDELKSAAQVVNLLKPLIKQQHTADATDQVLEISALLVTHDAASDARTLAKNFLDTNPKHPRAQFEWAAYLAAEDNAKESIALLKQAIETGGDPFKLLAGSDTRFDSIRNQRAFRKLVNP